MRMRVKHLHRRVVKGRVYYRHRKTGERLDKDGNGNPRTVEQIAARCMAINAQFETPAQARAAAGTLADLITQYKASHRFKALADQTKTSYVRSMDHLAVEYGDALVHEITTENVLDLQQDWSDKPRTADLHVSVLQILLNFAIQRRSRYGGITFNPATKKAGVERLHKTGGYDAWPDALIERTLGSAPEHVRWVIDMARFTGQRRGDLCKMRWSDIQGGAIAVTQSKTGAKLLIPIHPTLAVTLKTIPRCSLYILTNSRGLPWAERAMSGAVNAALDGAPYVLHGLRKNATKMLIEAGCSGEEVKSITGHATDVMVKHYSRQVRQAELARAAMLKWGGPEEREGNAAAAEMYNSPKTVQQGEADGL